MKNKGPVNNERLLSVKSVSMKQMIGTCAEVNDYWLATQHH